MPQYETFLSNFLTTVQHENSVDLASEISVFFCSPDIMMPAYDNNRAYVLFFVAFLLVNLYLFMRVFLAVIYNSYKDNLKTEVQDAVGLRRDLLHKAYTLICTQNGQMSKDNFKKVMNMTVKNRDEEFWEVAWLVLNPNNVPNLPIGNVQFF